MGMGGEHGLIEGKADISSCTPAHTDQLNGTQTEAGTQSELRHRTSFWQRSSPSWLPMEEEEEVRELPQGSGSETFQTPSSHAERGLRGGVPRVRDSHTLECCSCLNSLMGVREGKSTEGSYCHRQGLPPSRPFQKEKPNQQKPKQSVQQYGEASTGVSSW